jgi:hypothetical protein
MTGARLIGVALLLAVGVSGCGGGGGGGAGSPAPPVSVTIAWDPNRESGVNRAGGGYQVSISGQPTKDVPYTSGLTAPTSTNVSLQRGSYTVTVRAYAALDPQGGNTGNLSANSQVLTVNVP